MAKVEGAKAGDRSPKDDAVEVFGLVRDYAKQETLDPLKALGNYAKWGLMGAVIVGIGAIELMIAVLRLVQAEGGGAIDGRFSFVPYLVTLVVAVVALVVLRKLMTSKKVPVS